MGDVFTCNDWGQNIFRQCFFCNFLSHKGCDCRSHYIVAYCLWTTVFLLCITQNKKSFCLFTECEWSYWLLIYLSNMTAAKQAEHRSWREEKTSDSSIALLYSSDLHLLGLFARLVPCSGCLAVTSYPAAVRWWCWNSGFEWERRGLVLNIWWRFEMNRGDEECRHCPDSALLSLSLHCSGAQRCSCPGAYTERNLKGFSSSFKNDVNPHLDAS